MVAFYNQGDQDIYNQGVKFRPQQKYLLDDYTAPTAPTAQIKPVPGGITNTNAFNYGGGGNDFSVYNPDPNSIVNKNYNSRPAYETAFGTNLGDPEFNRATGALNSSGVLGDYREKPLTGTQEFLKFAGSFVPGAGVARFIGDYLPTNRRAIMENELGGKGIMVNNIGQVVQGKGDYNTAENVMAGYNADLITQKTIDKRQGKIEDTLRDKYNLTKSEIDSIKAGDITKDIIDKTKGSKLVDRYSAVGEYGDINNLTRDKSDDIYDFEKERKKKKRDSNIIGRYFKKRKEQKEDDRIAKEKADAAAKAQIERATKGRAPSDPGLRGRDDTPGFGKTSAGNYTNQFQGGDPGLMFAKGGRAGYFFGGRVNFKNGGLASIL